MFTKALLLTVAVSGVLCASVAGAASPVVSAAERSVTAGAALHKSTPLIIIRFNQKNVYYQRPLYSAIVRSLEVKPTVNFDIVSMVPITGDAALDEKNADISMKNVKRVFKDMVEMGIPDARMNVSREDSKGLATNEVHVFVR